VRRPPGVRVRRSAMQSVGYGRPPAAVDLERHRRLVSGAADGRLRQLESVLQLLSPGRQQPVSRRHLVRQYRTCLGCNIPGVQLTLVYFL